MNEWRTALTGAVRVGVLLGVSALTNLLVTPLEPTGAALVSEIVSVLLTAFVLGLIEAFLWGKPQLQVVWTDTRTRAQLPRLDVAVDETHMESSGFSLAIRCSAEKPFARWLIARAARARKLQLAIVPKHAPLMFSVDTSSRRTDDIPLVRREQNGPNVLALLEREPPQRGGVWVWAKGTFTAKEFLPGESWDLDYKVRGSWILRQVLAVDSDVTTITIQQR
ncbi:hypothetical protein ACFZA2_15370 [Microbacterium sp. NPDC007973]|uniref:hypothetical protein n=1 Tax=Microbacterium sp. NPDC007973 TaxID=3364182 RepID=UPI0036EF0469